jgi:RHS repeat-associated protein
VATNEVHYIYDGNLVIQERDVNNLPTASYARGSDLSGSPEGAGGIGGLLARSDATTGQPAFYYCDGNGNVRTLINSSNSVVARYIYDAFGNTLSKAGSLADANLYRFSSKEAHPTSGLVYYLYRFYDPNLQRWINRDPLGELGFDQLCQIKAPISGDGPNLYEFVRNNSITKYDIVGLTLTSCDCANFLKGALQGLSNLLAEDYKQGVYEGILFTTGGLLLSEVGGVILGGAGDIYDMYNTGQLIGEANEQMASAIKTYNACMTSVVNHAADPNSR